MRPRGKWAVGAVLLVLAVQPAWAHGAQIIATLTQGVQVRAVYDTGQPMAQAQVVLFAPTDPTRIWARGTTDDNGRFAFVPDPDQPGEWSVQVRQAGHGAMITVTTGDDGAQAVTTPAPPLTPWQRAMMVALVGWGALGTALFFRRRKGAGHASA